MKFNRVSEIEKYIQERGSVSLDELCDAFQVSKNTIRRDINELDKKGTIKKVYGGIISNPKAHVEPFESREIKNQAQKKVIAEIASTLVEDGDVIYVDSGTTSMHMIPFLAQKDNLTIVTANLNVIIAAISYPTLTVLSTGGVLTRATNSFTGPNVIEFLKHYNITKSFLASAGVSLSGVTHSSPLEYEIKKYLIEKSSFTALLVDSTKINMTSLMTYCKLDDLDYFISEKTPPREYVDFFETHNVKLLIPSQQAE